MFLCLLHVVVSPLEGVVGPRFEKEVLAFDGHERVERLDASESAAERYCQQAPTDGDDGNENDSRRRQRRIISSRVPVAAIIAVGYRLLTAPFCMGFAGIEAFCAFLAVATHRVCQPRQESLFERNAAS